MQYYYSNYPITIDVTEKNIDLVDCTQQYCLFLVRTSKESKESLPYPTGLLLMCIPSEVISLEMAFFPNPHL